MVRFYCDRCNNEVEGPDDLIEVVFEGRERANVAAWSWRSELCRSCYESLKESITTLIGAAEENKRKPVRRTAS